MWGKIWRLLVTVAMVLIVTSGAVSAHAELVKALPAPNSVVTPAPKSVALWFDEPIELSFSSVHVFDIHQVQVDNADLALAPNDPNQVTVSLKPQVDGTYTVVYQVLSAADGHVTSGNYAFGVGTATGASVTPAVTTSRSEQGGAVSIVIRALELWSILVLVGALFFRDLLLDRSLHAIRAPEAAARANGRIQILASAAVLLALFSLVLRLGLEASLITNAITPEGVGRLLSETRTGVLWLARFVLLTLMALVIPWISRRAGVASTSPQLFPLILGLAVLLTMALGSHGSAQGDLSIAVFVDWLHSAAVSLWVGGLAAFVWVITPVWRALPAEKRPVWLAALIPEFSRLAMTSVGVIAATGVYSAFIDVGSWDALLGTLYGEILSSKVALFVLMLVLAALNLFAMRHAFSTAESEEATARRYRVFRNLIAGEVMLGIIVIALAGFLTLAPPARGEFLAKKASPPPERLFLVSHSSPDLNIAVAITPSSGTFQTFEATVTNAGNQPASDALRVIFDFTWLEQDAGSTRVNVDSTENGSYRVSGNDLSLPGMWRLQVIVRRRGVEDVSATFPFYQTANATPAKIGDPTALALLKQSDGAMNKLKTLHSVQELNDGENGSVTTNYEYQAPDRLHFVIAGQGESVAVGGKQYYRDRGQQTWTESSRVYPFVFPSFDDASQAQGIKLGRTETLDGIPTRIVEVSIPLSDQQAHYAYWVGTQDWRVHQFFMVAPSHYMVQSYFDYDAPMEIKEPAAK